jgi:hypothetical protein
MTFTARVEDGGGRPAGTVQFRLDGMALGPPVALRRTRATMAVRSLPAGEEQVSVAFSSTDGFFPSTATITQTVRCH